MSRKQRIGRAVVRSEPAVIFEADDAEYELRLNVPSQKLDGVDVTDNPEVIISVDEKPAVPYGDENAPMLPFDRDFVLYLEEGQKVWAVCPGEGWLTFSALPMWRKS